MNKVIDLLKNHKSIRMFDLNAPISEEELKEILQAGQQASTWMNGQFYSVIRVKNKEIRQGLYNIAPPHMTFIMDCSELLVFVGDFSRQALASEIHGKENHAIGVNHLLTATTDAALAAQNMVIAAESLGLGCVYIGMVRRDGKKAATLLHLPEKTFPIFMVAMGKPDQERFTKPRIQTEVVVHMDTYKPVTEDELHHYDKVEHEFAGARKDVLWSENFAEYFATPPSEKFEAYLKTAKLLS
ncbi:MAG: nitroreductase family protein [Streptococcaceae bacterium]|jgi:nitroreductase|nr:nitroreductase family protein [Streptococcaceae bacterium]